MAKVKYVPTDDELSQWLHNNRNPTNPEWALSTKGYDDTRPADWCTADTLVNRRGMPRSAISWRAMVREVADLHTPTRGDSARLHTKSPDTEKILLVDGGRSVELKAQYNSTGIPCRRVDGHRMVWDIVDHRWIPGAPEVRLQLI